MTGYVERIGVTLDQANIHAGKMPLVIVLLDHLGILPRRMGLVAGWPTSPSTIGRDFPIRFHPGFPVTTPAIRHQRRRTILMGATPLNVRLQIDGGFRFILSQAPSDPQARARFDQGTPPICLSIVNLSHFVFLSLRPTYVASPSIGDGPIR